MPVNFPEKEVFLRLGGHLSKTLPAGEKYRLTAMQAYELCQPRGRWCVLEASAAKEGISLAGGRVLPGKDFASRSSGIKAIWCAAVTVGEKLVAFRDNAPNVTASAIADAVGSECADAAMDFLQKQAETELRRCGLLLAERRYSPGYGDMPLEVQKFLYETLKLDELGLRLTGNNFLIPEKSVTAIAGII